jgi:hypothetical protein
MRTFSSVVIELGSRGGTFILHEEYDKFGRFRFARIASHRMHIVGSFIEDLTRTQVLARASSYGEAVSFVARRMFAPLNSILVDRQQERPLEDH